MQKYSENLSVRAAAGQLQAVAGATIRVRSYPALADVVLYRTNDTGDAYGAAGTTLTTDANGRFEFYAPDGRYRIDWSATGIASGYVEDVLLEDPVEANTLAGRIAKARADSQFMVLARSAVQVVAPNDVAENILASITVPGGSLGLNGILRFHARFVTTNTGNNKLLRWRFGGVGGIQYAGVTATTTIYPQMRGELQNRNSQAAQEGGYMGTLGATTFGSSGATNVGALDTSVDQQLVITCQKAVGADPASLEGYFVELLPT